MKPKNRIVAVTLMMISLFAIAAFAQGRGQGRPQGGPPNGGQGGPGGPEMMLRFLELTDAQKDQVKALGEAEETRTEQFRNQIGEAHKALGEATAKGQFNEQQVRAIAAKIAEAEIEMTVSHARMQAAIYQILTAEQRARLDKLREEHRPPQGEMRRHRPPQ